jgi:hypothetical protein
LPVGLVAVAVGLGVLVPSDVLRVAVSSTVAVPVKGTVDVIVPAVGVIVIVVVG